MWPDSIERRVSASWKYESRFADLWLGLSHAPGSHCAQGSHGSFLILNRGSDKAPVLGKINMPCERTSAVMRPVAGIVVEFRVVRLCIPIAILGGVFSNRILITGRLRAVCSYVRNTARTVNRRQWSQQAELTCEDNFACQEVATAVFDSWAGVLGTICCIEPMCRPAQATVLCGVRYDSDAPLAAAWWHTSLRRGGVLKHCKRKLDLPCKVMQPTSRTDSATHCCLRKFRHRIPGFLYTVKRKRLGKDWQRQFSSGKWFPESSKCRCHTLRVRAECEQDVLKPASINFQHQCLNCSICAMSSITAGLIIHLVQGAKMHQSSLILYMLSKPKYSAQLTWKPANAMLLSHTAIKADLWRSRTRPSPAWSARILGWYPWNHASPSHPPWHGTNWCIHQNKHLYA